MPKIGSIGARIDLEVRAGDTLGPFDLTFTDPETRDPIDLTGSTLEAAISKLNDPDGDLPMTVVITDAVNGKARLSYAAADTADLAATDFFKATDQYSWYVKRTDPAGTKQTQMYGKVLVAKESPT